MAEREQFDDFEAQVEALEQAMAGTIGVAQAFEGSLSSMRATFADTDREVKNLSRGMSRGLKSAFEGLVFDGASLSDTLNGLAQSITRTAYNAAMRPVFDHFGGLLGAGVESIMASLLPFANGASFIEGRVVPFASGGIVSGPTAFPMRGATGLMGEAGPEAIMPLARGADGRLGVRSADGGRRPVTVVMNVTTPDVAGFERSRSQIAAQMARALSQGQRNR